MTPMSAQIVFSSSTASSATRTPRALPSWTMISLTGAFTKMRAPWASAQRAMAWARACMPPTGAAFVYCMVCSTMKPGTAIPFHHGWGPLPQEPTRIPQRRGSGRSICSSHSHSDMWRMASSKSGRASRMMVAKGWASTGMPQRSS
ncbi:MAG: hypothetical protein M5U14_07835 [Acidimicrobiia bacterium]|nr:hypothetical protein [Acidimicrobiia bacterium]